MRSRAASRARRPRRVIPPIAILAAAIGSLAVMGRLPRPVVGATKVVSSLSTRPRSAAARPGHPIVLAPPNVYAATMGPLDKRIAGVTPRVFVPDSSEGAVTVIDPKTYAVIDKFKVGRNPQHIGPSWDLSTLYSSNDLGNSLTPIDPRTAKPGPPISVTDPYNLYFTTDGMYAIVVAERFHRLDFRNPKTWAVAFSIPIAHRGANHLDFSADGKTLLLSCEFSGWVVKVDLAKRSVVGEINVGGEPIDVKLSPDGTVFYVANMKRGGVSIIDPATMVELAFLPTGMGAHGLYPSRDTKSLYVANRRSGTVSVIDFATRKVRATWTIGGSPDMGGVSTDGTELWLSGRYNSEVYVIDTRTGKLTHRIKVGRGPHGLSIFPQPGRYSMGHTGNFR